jgi:hypothetical protein
MQIGDANIDITSVTGIYKTADLHAVTCTIEVIELICIHASLNNGVNGLYGSTAVVLCL